jgi:hypothetical protein
MADNNILFHIKVDDKGTITHLKATKDGFKDLDLTVKNAKKSQELLTQAIKKMGKGGSIKGIKLTQQEYNKLIKTQNQLKDASGATTSAALELGRVISDAPYGIRGMANNLTQLVSQMAFATKASGSLGAALKGLWTSLMGPLGLVLAITGVISALDYFYGANKKAEKSTSDFKQEVEDLAETINTQLNVSIDDYIDLINKKNKLDDKVVESGKRVSEIEERLIEIAEERVYWEKVKNGEIESGGRSMSAIQGNLNNLAREENDLFKEKKTIYNSTADALNTYNKEKEAAEIGDLKTVASMEKYISSLKTQRKNIAETTEEWDKITKSIDFYQEKIDEITSKNKKKEEKIVDKPEEEVIIEGSVKWYKKLIATRQQDRDDFATTAKEYGRYTKEIEKYQKELDRLMNKPPDPKDRVGYASRLNMIDPAKEIKIAKKNFDTVVKYINQDLLKDGKFIDFSKNPNTKLDLEPLMPDEEDKEILRLRLDEYVDIYKQVLGGIGDFIQGESDRQLTIEANKTNAMNEELNNRLLNENMSVGERKRVQNQIAQNDEALRKKQNEIKKKAFNTSKAFNIAMATVETYSAATKVLNDPALIGQPWARFSMAAATITSGLLQVATIARQKFQPDAATTPIRTSGSGGSGGVGNRSFDFNLVGNNQGNQVVDAIQSQFDKPIKAYVVSKDITNAQQLDANTKSSARFGG